MAEKIDRQTLLEATTSPNQALILRGRTENFRVPHTKSRSVVLRKCRDTMGLRGEVSIRERSLEGYIYIGPEVAK